MRRTTQISNGTKWQNHYLQWNENNIMAQVMVYNTVEGECSGLVLSAGPQYHTSISFHDPDAEVGDLIDL